MSKKNIVLILVLACFLTIMSISIWGKLPELSSRIPVTEIQINDSNNQLITDINDSSLKEKKVTLNGNDYKDQDVVDYYFSVCVLPSNATELAVTYSILDNNYEEYVSINEIDYQSWCSNQKKEVPLETDIQEHVNYHFYKLTFTKKNSCTIKFQTNKTDVMKTDYLKVVWNISNEGGEIEI